MKPILSPKELAEAIGVSESSIKRWVDSDTIRATKTAGGHRRIPVTEAVRFIRETHSVLIKPEILGLSDVAAFDATASDDDDDARLFEFLRHGAADEARGTLLSLYLGGRSVAQIVDGPLRSAMERLGRLWREDDCGIFWEHRATEILLSAIMRLRMLIPPRPEGAIAVGGAPAGDPYLLPSLCAAAVLESQGFNAVNLGGETPISSIALASSSLRARLVWLSVSVVPEPHELARELGTLLDNLSEPKTPLVIGGSQAAHLQLPDSPYLHIGSSMGELEALVKGLRVSSDGPP